MTNVLLQLNLRRSLVAVAMAIMIAFGAALTSPTAAQAEPAGQYYYQCIGTNGASYFLAKGARLDSCKGSYLKKYINGNLITTVRLTGLGTPAKKVLFPTQCFIEIAGAGLLAVGTDGLSIAFVLEAAIAGHAVLSACRA
jgi:hypothetical protein